MIEEAEQIVYRVMHYGWPKQRASGWESPSTRERERERVGRGARGSANFPSSPAWRPNGLCLTQTGGAALRRDIDYSWFPFFLLQKTGPVPFQTWKETPPEKLWGHQGTFADGGRSAREMCPRFDATSPTGLWCGNKHIITAVLFPHCRSLSHEESPHSKVLFECHQSPNV